MIELFKLPKGTMVITMRGLIPWEVECTKRDWIANSMEIEDYDLQGRIYWLVWLKVVVDGYTGFLAREEYFVQVG